MPTLTADQIEDIRQKVGDTDTPPDVTDAQIQRDYDAAYALEGEASETTDAITIVYVIRRLLGTVRKKVDVGGEVERETRSQLFKHLKEELLPYYEGLAGLGGVGVMTTGSLSLNLDTDCDYLTDVGLWDT